jgi:GNAT superfamily N-acetyltransferase
VLRWEGPGALVLRVIRRLLHPVLRVRRLLFFEADLTVPQPRLQARVPLELRLATLDDVEQHAEGLATLGLDPAEARQRLERGDLGVLGLSGGHLVHVGWITFGSPWIDELGARLLLQPGEACAYDAVTHPDWRGHGIHLAASAYRARIQRARGATRHFSWVWADNVQNTRNQARRGRRLARTVWTVWVRGMRRPLLIGAGGPGSPVLERPSRGPGRRLPTRPPHP